MLRPINPPNATIPGISQAMLVESGRLLLLSGHVPYDEAGKLVGDDLASQLDRVFANLLATLKAAGTDFSAVARVTIYVQDYDPSQLPIIREVRNRWIGEQHKPASSLIGVASLFQPGVLVEIDAIAVLPEEKA
ncbi:RidA family protein [Labrys sp. ZIDIC5]|uniref:RidA family protein n=1 Tax=Labrys sedimenti TaxID=3106036 RepID=UPI002ACA5421|nr:RidA family protein [Labrys sp. ZIDIC5]MDZ5450743.1 RidA family protein [Labrys sp. ZIDIC5]